MIAASRAKRAARSDAWCSQFFAAAKGVHESYLLMRGVVRVLPDPCHDRELGEMHLTIVERWWGRLFRRSNELILRGCVYTATNCSVLPEVGSVTNREYCKNG